MLTQKRPGPTAFLALRRPRRKMAALSYSCTILTQNQSEIGKKSTIRKVVIPTRAFPQQSCSKSASKYENIKYKVAGS